jgi:hypothetical protein
MSGYEQYVSALESKPNAVELLHALDDLSGRATLTELKNYQPDWETHHVDYRANICKDLHLVMQGVENEDEPGQSQRYWVLNELGEKVLAAWDEKHERTAAVDDNETVELTRGEYVRFRETASVMDGMLEAVEDTAYKADPEDVLPYLVSVIDSMDGFLTAHSEKIVALDGSDTSYDTTAQ